MTYDEEYQNPEVLRDLYWNKGMNQPEIAEELGCSRQLITHYFKKYEIPLRSRSERIRGGLVGDQPWHDERVLSRLYCDEKMTQKEIAGELGTTRSTIKRWMKHHGIDTRSPREVHEIRGNTGITFRTDDRGYERIDVRDGDTTRHFPLHRLLMMIEHGTEKIEGKHVHHINHITWDNRPENLTLVTPSEHVSLHTRSDG